jgi:hypothetical protein
MHSLLRSLAVPLLMMTLVFGVPRYVEGTTDGSGGGARDYGTFSTAPNPSEQAPPESIPDHDLTLPALEQIDPDPEASAGSSSYQISP